MSEEELLRCQHGDSWICPVTSCGKRLSRKQTLKSHLKTLHGVKVKQKLQDSMPLPMPAENSVMSDSSNIVVDEHVASSSVTVLSHPTGSDHLSDDYEEEDMDLCSVSSEEVTSSEDDSESEPENDNACTPITISPPLYVLPTDSVTNSPISYIQHLLSLCAFSLKHNMSGVAMNDLARLIQLHLPDNSICELDINKIKKMCASLDTIVVHEYCTICTALYPQDKAVLSCETPGCPGTKTIGNDCDKSNTFTSTPLDSQIQNILERDDNFDKVQSSHSRTSDNICDITSGNMYDQLKKEGGFLFPANNNNITLTCFTDGVPLYKSSKVSLWPLYLVINELPPNERYLTKNMLIWGIWQGSNKLQMNAFLQPFVVELQKLYTDGFTFRTQGRDHSGRACLAVFTMDMQARAPVVNMAHHNGEFGCLYCEIPGNVVPSGKSHARAYPYPAVKFPSRSDDMLLHNIGLKGIRGPSVLQAAPGFSITTGVVIDYMHGALLGITKKLLELWFDGKSYREDYFIGHKVGEIDQMIMTIQPPYFIKRLPRKIQNNYTHWKASEFRSWLLFYSLPCLSEILPDVYLHHFACLVEGIFILLGDSITSDDLVRAYLLLNAFYQNCGDLYGLRIVGLNIHNLSHLVQCVQNWGPLWAYSCFGFKSFNADILKLVHGTGNVAQQIIWSLNAQKNLELETKNLPDSALKSFFKDMLQRSSARLPKGEQAHHCRIVKPSDVRQNVTFSLNLIASLKNVLGLNDIIKADFKQASKVVYGQAILYSMACTREKRRNSYTIHVSEQKDTANILIIDYFLLHKTSKRVLAVGSLFRMEQEVVRGRAAHCQKFRKNRDDACILIVSGAIIDHVIYLENKFTGQFFALRMANHVERD